MDQRRQSFGGWAREYDRFRPGYPDAVVAWMLAPVAGADGGARATVLDLGSGTGLLARSVLRLGHRVLVVEPDDRMRAVAAELVGKGSSYAGSAEGIPLPDASVDAVLVGQAWHWVDPVRAVPEVARVLRPGGVLGIVWNLRDDREPWVAALGDLLALEDGYLGFRSVDVPQLDDALFSPVTRHDVEHRVDVDEERLVALVGTFSAIALRPDSAQVLQRVRDLVRGRPELDPEGFVLPYVALAYRALRH